MLDDSSNPLSLTESGTSTAGSAEAGEHRVRGGGRVIHDSRGNAVWDWAVATGVLTGKKAAELLCLLDNPTLALEPEGELAPEWGGDPYNRR